MLTAAQFEKNQALLADPSKNFTPEARAKAQAAVDEFRTQFLTRGAYSGQGGSLSDVQSVGSTRAPIGATPPPADPEQMKVQELLSKLDPGMSIPAQVYATQPSTTHPEGDEKAEEEWVRGDLSNPNLVVVYDAPVKKVREDLLEHPELFRALGLDIPSTPEEVMNIQPGDSTHQAYNGMKWRETADAAAQAGKTAYRYSMAPWMSGGKNAGFLDTLKTKVTAATAPFGEGTMAFVMGVDKTAVFGAGRAALEAANPEMGTARLGQETAGGIPDAPARERDAMLQEEHPMLYALGQGVGALAPWSLSNKVYNATLAAGAKVAGKVGGAAAPLARVAGAAAGGAAGGALNQAAEEGVDAAASGGASLEGAPRRVGSAAATAGALGSAGKLAEEAVTGVGNWVREGEYLEGLPGRIERHGVQPKFGRGYVDPPEVVAAKREAKASGRDDKPIDVLAEKLDKPMTDAAKAHTESVTERVKRENAAVYASPEGQQLLPTRRTTEEAYAQLKQRAASNSKQQAPTAVGIPNAPSAVKGVFNTHIEGVSVKPVDGWIPMPANHAEAFLSPVMQKRTLRAARTGKPAMRGDRPRAPKAPAPEGAPKPAGVLDFEGAKARPPAARVTGKPGAFIRKLEKRGVDTVYVAPRLLNAEHQESAIRRLRTKFRKNKSDPDLEKPYRAAMEDRKQRVWQGEQGGFSKLQKQHSKDIDAAKKTQQRVAPDATGAYQQIIKLSQQRSGQGRAQQAMRETAARAGGDAPAQLNASQVMHPMQKLKARTSFGKDSRGQRRGWFGIPIPQVGDMALMRGIYPTTRALEKAPIAKHAVKLARARRIPDDRAEAVEKEREKLKAKAEGYAERAGTAEPKKSESHAKKSHRRRLRRKDSK